MSYLIILLGAVLRVIPHPANFAPIAAIALFGGTYIKNKKLALALPLLAMVISDIFIGFDSIQMRAVVYGSFILIGLVGFIIRKHKNLATIFGSTLLGSILFYLITNFAFFYSSSMYPHDFSGIVSSYINALPFFRNSLMGNFFYVSVFFGSYELVLLYKQYRISLPLRGEGPRER
ncbi:MAG: hypothetical protein Q8P83_03705 [bacterium]|nr:hypothetical protein [bacterium]